LVRLWETAPKLQDRLYATIEESVTGRKHGNALGNTGRLDKKQVRGPIEFAPLPERGVDLTEGTQPEPGAGPKPTRRSFPVFRIL
jgi:hypothetical protein